MSSIPAVEQKHLYDLHNLFLALVFMSFKKKENI